jgi:L-asparagine transporter-like permease
MDYLIAQTGASMPSYYEDMNGWGRVFLAGIVCAAIVAVIGFVMILIDSIHRRHGETSIKHEMIERGFSADEIERILAAKSASTTEHPFKSLNR